ncbi:CHAP domain-containing protein [Treponema putidum]|uniref:CHAP domain-containing protein n=1 Tax=Treponema putidum TaxID=221027 RepID=UPI003D8A142C
MTLDEFVKTYLDKKVDYDGRYGAQCVDLFRQYCKDVLNIPQPSGVMGARELYTEYEKKPVEVKYFERLPYPENKPIAGDVVVFDKMQGNPYGHVAIVIAADKNYIKVLEQDGYAQTGTKFAYWKYTHVLGFLRKREEA